MTRRLRVNPECFFVFGLLSLAFSIVACAFCFVWKLKIDFELNNFSSSFMLSLSVCFRCRSPEHQFLINIRSVVSYAFSDNSSTLCLLKCISISLSMDFCWKHQTCWEMELWLTEGNLMDRLGSRSNVKACFLLYFFREITVVHLKVNWLKAIESRHRFCEWRKQTSCINLCNFSLSFECFSVWICDFI